MSAGTDPDPDFHHDPAATVRAPERVILVGVCLDRRQRDQVADYLDELASLTRTAGGVVVDRCVQERRQPDPASFIGRGKAAALADRVREHAADLVIFDDDLSPAQVRELERVVEARVIDRSGLILDIFAGRARSKEARTQVQAAQLEYLLPRLAGRWGHLAGQQGGVIGMRGVGEKQIEIDRRLVRHKLVRLKQELARIEAGRRRRRVAREGTPRVAVVGYTNAGKSSLVNALAGSDCVVEDRLFSTLDPRTRAARLGPRASALLVDTVGFLRKLPHHLIASFRSTLEETASADLLLHVVDVSHPAFEEQVRVTREAIAEIGAAGRPEVLVFNKADLLPAGGLRERLRSLYPEAPWVSAARGWGLEALRTRLLDALWEGRPLRRVSLPAARQDLVHRVYETAQVIGQRYRGERVILEYRASPAQEGQIAQALGPYAPSARRGRAGAPAPQTARAARSGGSRAPRRRAASAARRIAGARG